jgi:hypothetical protein
MSSKSMILGYGWHSVQRFLPYDLDTFAVDSGALERRRGVKSGSRLVQTLCLCALPNMTFEVAAQIARDSRIASLSGQALFKRMVGAEALLEGLFVHSLRYVSSNTGKTWNGLRLVAVDATTLCGPGSKGTDQRLHVVYDLGKGVPASVDLTNMKGGETFKRHDSFGFGDLVMADACYGVGPGLMSALRSGSRILVRFNFESIRLLGEDGEKIWPEQAEGVLPDEGYVDFCGYLPDWPAPLRVIGGRNNEGKGVWLITDLSRDELPTDSARELYSQRWQIELYFKRLKSILDLDELPTRDGPSTRPWIWAKLLLATLAVLLADERFSPWEQSAEPLGEDLEGACKTMEVDPIGVAA